MLKLHKVENLPFKTKYSDLENMFNVHPDKFNNWAPNINETVYLDIHPESLLVYIPDHPIHWGLLSYKLYGTTRLTWLLLKINKVKPENLFDRLTPGIPVFYIDEGEAMSLAASITDEY